MRIIKYQKNIRSKCPKRRNINETTGNEQTHNKTRAIY